MDRGEPYLDDLRIVLSAFLQSARDGGKRIYTLFLGFFLEIGIYLDREDIRLDESELSYVSSGLRHIIVHFSYLDIGIVSIYLILEKLCIIAIDREKESDNSADIRHLEAELRCCVFFTEKRLVFLKRIMEDVQNLLRHENTFFVEAIDRYFEDSSFFIHNKADCNQKV